MIQISNNLKILESQVAANMVPSEIAFLLLSALLQSAEAADSMIRLPLVDDSADFTLDIVGQFGGDCFIVETYPDLQEIEGCSPPGLKVESSKLTDGAYVFDVAEVLFNGWILLVLMTNNGGGNSYYIPPKFLASCPYLGLAVKHAQENG